MNESFIDNYVVVRWNASEPEKALVEFLEIGADESFKRDLKGYERVRHFFLDEDYDYLAIALTIWATEMWCEDEMTAESFILNEGKSGFVINIETKEARLVTKSSWEDRDKAKTVEEAMSYISDYLALSSGTNLKEVSKYAKKWKIPFSLELMKSVAEKKELIDYVRWNSSYC